MQKLRWTVGPAIAVVIFALLACKKKEEEAPPPATTTEPPPPPPSATAEAPKEDKNAVKRYGDKEQDESGTVRVTFMHSKVFKEADETTSHIATLSTGTLVNRKARYGNWMLIDYPSGVGELSPGWVLGKYLSGTVLKIDLNLVKNQDAGVTLVDAGTTTVPDAGTTTVPDAGTTAKPDAAVTPPTPDGGRLPDRKKIKPATAKTPG